MGADAFHVYYGLRWEVIADDKEAVELLEKRQDARQLAARAHKLDCWWGVTADERRCFVLVGKRLGNFGWEHQHEAQFEEAGLATLVEETKRRLREAGFEGAPAWQFQFEPDY